jgi:alanine or glycine:cation symporter, AGCS family
MTAFDAFLSRANAVLWHDLVLFILLGVGLLFTIWSGFSQYRALTHGVAAVRGKYDRKGDPGAISHFQALSAALSATVGLGNIGGVALAIALGGPGAVFWMWVIGLVGMALKTVEVIQSMLYRNVDDPENPHGGPMWVVSRGLAQMNPRFAKLGMGIGMIFCVTLLISAITGGNMFQAWNVGLLTQAHFGIPAQAAGIILAILVGLVIIGGIKRIGSVAGRLVPVMCLLYLVAATYVLVMRADALPGVFKLIITSAFSPTEAQGAFLGGSVAMAFLFGLKRAFFSNEAGQGSAPIAHSAARTSEPVREGVVAGLEPFIDTIIVCTLTAFVILASGAWNRPPAGFFADAPEWREVVPGEWTLESVPAPRKSQEEFRVSGPWRPAENIFMVVGVAEGGQTALRRLMGEISLTDDGPVIRWGSISSETIPEIQEVGVFREYPGAMLTSYAFDRVLPGLGGFLVPLAAWLFAISTMISWAYYGEQAIVFMMGKRFVLPYQIIYCILIIVACSGWITTDAQLDNLVGFGTGVMLFANIPIMLIFGRQAIRAYKDYLRRLDAGEMPQHEAATMVDLVHGGKDRDR